MAEMKDARVAALAVVAEELLRADFGDDVMDLLDAALMIARARGLNLDEVEPLAAIPFEDRSPRDARDWLSASSDTN